MAYVVPQVQVFQEFNLGVDVALQNLNAFYAGGHAYLLRYAEADEKSQALLGTYDHVGTNIDGTFQTCYDWPNKPTGSLIDTDYTRVFLDNALLRYYRDTSHQLIKVDRNKVRHPSKSFIANPADAETYPRAADFYDRDVKVGDIVQISGIPTAVPAGSSSSSEVAGDRVYLCTYVQDIEADAVAAVVGTPEANDANQATQILATSSSANADNSGDAAIDSVSGASYDGHDDGDLSETYTITVIQASTDGDATTARLRVVSASGRDDVAEVTPAAFGSPTAIGARGLTVTWAGASTEFTLDDEWTVEVDQAFTAPTTAAGGTYTGARDLVYEIEVTKGGLFAAEPEITVVATDGTDFSGPTVVATSGDDVSIGTLGVTFTFTGTALRKGDRWTVTATAETEGPYRILVLAHDLNDDIDEDDASSAQLEMSLYIRKNIELPRQHARIGGQYNWSQSDTEICLHAGIEAYDEEWTDDGTELPLAVISDSNCAGNNQLYVQYRAWRSDLADSVRGLSTTAELDDVAGPLTPDNPLKWALYMGLQNSNGQELKYMAVTDPADSDAWVTVLDAIEDRQDVYGLVPLTTDATILGLFVAHVGTQSTELRGRWRSLWVALADEPTVAVLTAEETDDGEVLLATTEDDPDTSGTQYTKMRITSGNVELVQSGVRAGDKVRFLYTTDGWGNSSYSEYTIDAVLNETTLRLVSGTDVAQNIPKKAEIWRTRTVQERADALAVKAGAYGDRRIRAVWPDTFDGSGEEDLAGIYLCAALAALAGGVAPHQSLTNLELSGVTSVDRTTKLFNRSQLDTMAEAGVWIVTQHPRTGEIYTRHAVTTGDTSDINEREEMAVRNTDSISYYFLDKFSPYIGVANATPGMLEIIEAETRSGIAYLRDANFSQRLGGQIIDAEIDQLYVSTVFRDRIVLSLNVTLPYPLNVIECHLMI